MARVRQTPMASTALPLAPGRCKPHGVDGSPRLLTMCSHGGFRESLWAEKVFAGKLKPMAEAIFGAWEAAVVSASVAGAKFRPTDICDAEDSKSGREATPADIAGGADRPGPHGFRDATTAQVPQTPIPTVATAELALTLLASVTKIHLLTSVAFLQQLTDMRLGVLGDGHSHKQRVPEGCDTIKLVHDCRKQLFREFSSLRESCGEEDVLCLPEFDDLMRSQPVMVWDLARHHRPTTLPSLPTETGKTDAAEAGASEGVPRAIPNWWPAAMVDRVRASLPQSVTELSSSGAGPGGGNGDMSAEIQNLRDELRVMQDRALRAEAALGDFRIETQKIQLELQSALIDARIAREQLADAEGQTASLRLYVADLQQRCKTAAQQGSENSEAEAAAGNPHWHVRLRRCELCGGVLDDALVRVDVPGCRSKEGGESCTPPPKAGDMPPTEARDCVGVDTPGKSTHVAHDRASPSGSLAAACRGCASGAVADDVGGGDSSSFVGACDADTQTSIELHGSPTASPNPRLLGLPQVTDGSPPETIGELENCRSRSRASSLSSVAGGRRHLRTFTSSANPNSSPAVVRAAASGAPTTPGGGRRKEDGQPGGAAADSASAKAARFLRARSKSFPKLGDERSTGRGAENPGDRKNAGVRRSAAEISDAGDDRDPPLPSCQNIAGHGSPSAASSAAAPSAAGSATMPSDARWAEGPSAAGSPSAARSPSAAPSASFHPVSVDAAMNVMADAAAALGASDHALATASPAQILEVGSAAVRAAELAAPGSWQHEAATLMSELCKLRASVSVKRKPRLGNAVSAGASALIDWSLASPRVFQRLYQDAVERLERLEQFASEMHGRAQEALLKILAAARRHAKHVQELCPRQLLFEPPELSIPEQWPAKAALGGGHVRGPTPRQASPSPLCRNTASVPAPPRSAATSGGAEGADSPISVSHASRGARKRSTSDTALQPRQEAQRRSGGNATVTQSRVPILRSMHGIAKTVVAAGAPMQKFPTATAFPS